MARRRQEALSEVESERQFAGSEVDQNAKIDADHGPKRSSHVGWSIKNPDNQGGEYCVEIFNENDILGLRKV